MSFDTQNFPLENFWQFAHYHPIGAILIMVGVFIILIILCIIILNLVFVLKKVSNKLNTFTVGEMTFSLSDKSLKSAEIESMIQQALSRNDEHRRSFESEAWNLLKSGFLKDPYKDWQYAAVAVTILKHTLGVELKSAKGDVYTAVMCDDKGSYYFSLYSQEATSSLDETKRVSKHFTTAAEIDLFLNKH